MINNKDIISKVIELYETNDEFDDINTSFLNYSFPLIEQVDVGLLNSCNEQIPAKNVCVTGYYCNMDENYISIYLSCFDKFAKVGQIINEDLFESCKLSLINLIKMIDDNSYREINEGRLIFDLCDFVVEHSEMELVVNIITNYTVPIGFEKDGNYQIGKRMVCIRTYDIVDLLDKVNASKENNPSLDLTEKFGKRIPALMISSDSNVDVYLTSLQGGWLAQLYKEDSVGLLSSNVRSYLKRTNKVNREIIETVRETPKEFVAYNNGLSAVATEIHCEESSEGLLINAIDGFMIVNGGQTTATLYECQNDKLDLSNIIVPLKLSVIKNTEEAELLIENISLYSNTQSTIKRSDPASNNRFYKRFEDISRMIFASKNMTQYHCYFERTNGQYYTQKRMHTKDSFSLLNPEKAKFTKLELAQAIVSWEQSPHVVCLGQEKNFGYFHEIVKDYNPNIVDERFFKASYALVLLYRKLDFIIKELGLPYKSSLLAYTMSYFSLVCKKQFDLLWLWELQEIPSTLEEILKDMVRDVYSKLIESPENYPDIRMWSRKVDCWEHVKSQIKEYDIEIFEYKWELLPLNPAKEYIDGNLKNPSLWQSIEKWEMFNSCFSDSQKRMIHGMPSIIYKDEKSMKKMTKKQEKFARSIFMQAVENGFEFE